MINQVRDYIPHLANYLLPLQMKLQKDVEFICTSKDEKQLINIKDLCKELPKLQHPNEEKQFLWILETDAGEKSYGAILKYQYNNEKTENICKYTSGTFKNNEVNWEINRKDLFAVYKGILAF